MCEQRTIHSVVIFSLAIMILLMILLMATTLPGCKEESFSKNTYKTLKSAQTVYDTLMKTAADYRVNNKLTQEQWDKLSPVAEKFRASGMTASKVMSSYVDAIVENPDSEGSANAKRSVLAALSSLSANYKDLLSLAQELGIMVLPLDTTN